MLEFEKDVWLDKGMGGYYGFFPDHLAEKYFPEAVKEIKGALISGSIPDVYYGSDQSAISALQYRLDTYTNVAISDNVALLLVGMVRYQRGNSWHKACRVGWLTDNEHPN
jgi:hypothetical protein